MIRSQAKGLTQSVLDRLKNLARSENRPYAEYLQLYALERFLYRLSQIPQSHRFILKGALMLRIWEGVESRPTRDIDLLGPIDISADEVEALIRECATVDVPPDGVDLDPESIRVIPIRIPDLHVGFRARFDGYMARTKLRFQIDIGTGDSVVPEPVTIEYPVLLGFPPPRLRAYTPYTTVAEKFEAIVKLGLANTRLKDYFDFVALSAKLDFDGEILTSALTQTFGRRGIELPTATPSGLTDDFFLKPEKIIQWEAFVRKNRLEGSALPLDIAVVRARDFLMPAVNAAARKEPFPMIWPPGGPWETR